MAQQRLSAGTGLGHQPTSPLDQVYVSLDLETTGLDADRDTILEIGAVRFRGDEVLDTFETFVNPGRAIPDHIQRLTGIRPRQVERAPSFAVIAGEFAEFLGTNPVVGHNVQFDLRFLASHRLPVANAAYDTMDLATVFLPRSRRYSLKHLADHFGVELRNHRALDDAIGGKELFVRLLRLAGEQDGGLLAYVSELARRSSWSLYPALSGLAVNRSDGPPAVGPAGLNLDLLAQRVEPPEKRRPAENLDYLDQEQIHGMLGPDGPFAKAFEGFEHRKEQEEMLDAVADAIYNQHHLVVEGGTGVGKSLAYLLPAALFAVANGQRVVVSTNTINLQEQLIGKDIPALKSVLEKAGLLEPDALKATLLKGKANYICLRRWQQLSRSDALSVDDAKLLSKTAMWLQDTSSGDRGEINLNGREIPAWNHVSAGERGFCIDMRDGSPCFLRAARNRAEQAHIIIVNHALLMSDLVFGGLIPDYDTVIIDEAHHLEDAATNQFGFELPQGELERLLEPVGRLTRDVRQALTTSELEPATLDIGQSAVSSVEAEGPRLRQAWEQLFTAVEALHIGQRRGRNQGDQNQMLITNEVRNTSAWGELHLAWENLNTRLGQIGIALRNVRSFLDGNDLPAAPDQQALEMEASSLSEDLAELANHLASILDNAPEDAIHWVNVNPSQGTISLHSAPLDVSPILAEKLFNEKDCVILTSATLTTGGSFQYLKRRVGIDEDTSDLLVGSPFDYERAAQALIPEDMPQPNANGYVAATADVLAQLGQKLQGRTMALFTSHSSLRAVAQRLRPMLEPYGIPVMAQGVDGSAPYLMAAFGEEPNSVLLGTASFWEGVDMPTGLLKALVLTRLPFQVPSDPIVQCRSGLYEDPFNEYSIPNAVLRFRQGLGRLIRNKDDRGTIVVLDSRISTHGYGQAFRDSMPPCHHTPCLTSNVGMLAEMWLEGGKQGGRRASRLR
jgi:DNA polymerase-3 subunit epsilon/ATP-dependent DNA helicase DinG